MMGGLTPLQGLQVIDNPQPFATPEERSGGPADPRHGQPGEQAEPYPWNLVGGVQYPGHVGPQGFENQILGFDYADDVDPAGMLSQDPTADMTPNTAAGGRITHAAPWPKGVPMDMAPDTVAAQRQASADIHAADTGASRALAYSPTLDARQDNWRDFYDVEPGTSLQQPVPKQVGFAVAGFGSRDRAQSLAGQNSYGFDSSHAHRRYADSPIPGNDMWMKPGGRPMMKTVAGYPNRFPNGSNSPFTGDDTGASFGQYGAVLDTLPGEYQAPPEPALAKPVYDSSESPSVDLW